MSIFFTYSCVRVFCCNGCVGRVAHGVVVVKRFAVKNAFFVWAGVQSALPYQFYSRIARTGIIKKNDLLQKMHEAGATYGLNVVRE